MEGTDNKKVANTDERNEWFNTHWPQALRMFIAMTLFPKQQPLDKLMEALGHMVSIVSDMREVDLKQQAEIESLKALLKMGEK